MCVQVPPNAGADLLVASSDKHLLLFDARTSQEPLLKWRHEMPHEPPGLLTLLTNEPLGHCNTTAATAAAAAITSQRFSGAGQPSQQQGLAGSATLVNGSAALQAGGSQQDRPATLRSAERWLQTQKSGFSSTLLSQTFSENDGAAAFGAWQQTQTAHDGTEQEPATGVANLAADGESDDGPGIRLEGTVVMANIGHGNAHAVEFGLGRNSSLHSSASAAAPQPPKKSRRAGLRGAAEAATDIEAPHAAAVHSMAVSSSSVVSYGATYTLCDPTNKTIDPQVLNNLYHERSVMYPIHEHDLEGAVGYYWRYSTCIAVRY